MEPLIAPARRPTSIVVLGASGRTGRRVVEQALTRGCTVRAVSRHARAALPAATGLERCDIDLLRADPSALSGVLGDGGAIVSTLGVGSSRAPTTLYSVAVATVLAVRPAARIAVVSAVPVGGTHGHAFPERRIAIPLLRRAFRATYEDMARMEQHLATSGAAWAVLRAPRLRDGAPTGRLVQAGAPIAGGRSVTTGDLAEALLEAACGEPSQEVRYVATGARHTARSLGAR